MSPRADEPINYTIPEAADMARVSENTVRRAINATDPKAFPPPLKAKRMGPTGAQRIRRVDLVAWIDNWPDA